MGTLSVAVNLPYKQEVVDSDVDFYNDIESSPLYKMLPANAKEYVKASPHLLESSYFSGKHVWHPALFIGIEKRSP